MREKFAIAALSVVAAAALNAAGFWTSKPYSQWTDKEVHKILTDSPWAWQSPIGNNGEAVPSVATLLWQSALPVKRALYGLDASVDPQSQALLDRVEPYYLLHISGIPIFYRATADIEKVKAATALKVKGREPLHPAEVEIFEAAPTPLIQPTQTPMQIRTLPIEVRKNFQTGGSAPTFVIQSIDVYFGFPKNTAFKMEDQELEFETNIGGFSIRRKFKLKDMVYEGKLEI